MRVLVFCLAFLLSCGSEDHTNPLHPVVPDRGHEKKIVLDEELAPYVWSFEADWQKNHFGLPEIEDLIVEFGVIEQDPETPTFILGKCYVKQDTTPRIVIDTTRWDKMSDVRRETLMYHELGHCALFRQHVEGVNTSIMNPLLISSKTYEENREELLEELFDPNKYNDWKVLGLHDHTDCNH